MNLLLAILLGTGAVIGALGMLVLIAGGVAAAMIEADRGIDGRVDATAGRPLATRSSSPTGTRPHVPAAASPVAERATTPVAA